MSKVFTSKQFIEKLKWLVYDVPNYYHSENGTWCNYNKSRGKFMMDCVVSIKGLLWGFKADKNKAHGGGIYLSNGVADFGANDGIDYCTDASQDFHHLTSGEYLCMRGTKYSHAGIYLGNGKVFECTAGWGVNRCIISEINDNGDRIYNGVPNVKWTYHGKLKYIDYSDQNEQPVNKKTIEQLANEVIKGEWGNGEERKRRLTNAGYNYADVQRRVNEIVYGTSKKYIQINARLGVWCRTGGYGFNHPKYKVIPNGTKCELLAKNVGYANGYNWDKVIYDGREVYLPNAWNKYL